MKHSFSYYYGAILGGAIGDALGAPVEFMNYEQIEVDDGLTRVFYDRYYAFSIPVSERANNTLCGDNNPGW